MRAINKSSKSHKRVSIRKRGIKMLEHYMLEEDRVHYVGPEFLGDYGIVDMTEPMWSKRYLYGISNTVYVIDGGYAIVDANHGAKRITENLYDNGRGNLVFIYEDDKNTFSHYFNVSDSNIIRKWLLTRGRKYIGCREDLFEVIGEYKLKRLFDGKLRDNDITIDSKHHNFRSYNEFYRELRKHVFSGYSASFDIMCNNEEYRVTFHGVGGWNFPEVE